MEPAVVGPYVLLALGAAAVVAAIIGQLKQSPLKNTGVSFVFGLAMLGTGSYGPAFLADYAGFIKELNEMVSTVKPDAEQVVELVESARKAGVSEKAREAIMIDVFSRTATAESSQAGTEVAALKETLEKRLPPESENRKLVSEASARVQAEVRVRDLARRHIEEAANQSGPALEAEEVKPLLELEDEQLSALRLERSVVTRAAARPRDEG